MKADDLFKLEDYIAVYEDKSKVIFAEPETRKYQIIIDTKNKYVELWRNNQMSVLTFRELKAIRKKIKEMEKQKNESM